VETEFFKYLNQIDEKELVALCQSLIKIPSHKEIKGRERKIALFIKDILEREGVEVHLQQVTEERANVIARIKGEDEGKSLLFNGHMDTVRPYEMDDPYGAKIEAGKIWGRGAADMKAGLAGMIYTLIVLKRAKVKLKGDLILAAVLGEENVSEGTQYLVKNGPWADMAIVGEPTHLGIVTTHKGIQWLEVTVKGRSAHAGIPHRGINAIVGAARLICSIEEKLTPKLLAKSHPLLGSPTFNIGKIRGGTRNSLVPEICKFQLDRRMIPGEKVEDVLREIRDIIDDLKKTYRELNAEVVSIPTGPEDERELREIKKQGIEIPPHEPMEIPEESEIVKVLKEALLSTGENPRITGMSGWTDASLLVNMAKISTAVFGPGNINQAHTSEEYVEIKELVKATKVYVFTALKICELKRG